jgi:hypothetical protein
MTLPDASVSRVLASRRPGRWHRAAYWRDMAMRISLSLLRAECHHPVRVTNLTT